MNIRTAIFSFLSFFISFVGISQEYKFLYYLDHEFNTIEKSKAVIIGKGRMENGLMLLDCFSVKENQLYMQLHFKDSSLTQLQGPFKSLHMNGKLEKRGNFDNGFEEGPWENWDGDGRRTDSSFYKDGYVYFLKTFKYFPNGILAYTTIKDSMVNSYQTFNFDSTGMLVEKTSFIGDRGVVINIRNNVEKADSVFSRKIKDAEFPGGIMGWNSYLKNNLNAGIPIEYGAKAGVYTVIIKFNIQHDGSITDVKSETAHGYGMEKEIIRVILKGPKWIPAEKYGQKIISEKRQPATFVIAEN